MIRSSNWIHVLVLLLASPAPGWAGWPFSSDDGPPHGSEEWYECHAQDPVGARQKYKYGKLWPPQPRPVGAEQLSIHKYHASHYWPYPYYCHDRAIVRGISQVQIMNGWMAAMTLYDYHFDPETQELNTAGRKHLWWILTTAPEEFRQMYVASSMDPAQSSRRVASVQREATTLVGELQVPPIGLRIAAPAGRPASEVQSIVEGREKNMLPPTIQYIPGTTPSN